MQEQDDDVHNSDTARILVLASGTLQTIRRPVGRSERHWLSFIQPLQGQGEQGVVEAEDRDIIFHVTLEYTPLGVPSSLLPLIGLVVVLLPVLARLAWILTCYTVDAYDGKSLNEIALFHFPFFSFFSKKRIPLLVAVGVGRAQ